MQKNHKSRRFPLKRFAVPCLFETATILSQQVWNMNDGEASLCTVYEQIIRIRFCSYQHLMQLPLAKAVLG